MKYFFCLLFFIYTISTFGQDKSWIHSGPMAGNFSSDSVLIWVKTTKACTIKVCIQVIGNNNRVCSKEYLADSTSDYIAKVRLSGLEKDKSYNYSIFINDQRLNFDDTLSFFTAPENGTEDDFVVALGSCTSVLSQSEKEHYKVFNSIVAQQPQFMLWMGDNTYLSKKQYCSPEGILEGYAQTRSIPELQHLLHRTNHLAIWDDHDYGHNNSDCTFVFKETSMKAFESYWVNPGYGFDGKKCAVTTFTWGDVQFFLLDNRSFRFRPWFWLSTNRLLGKKQISWLTDEMKKSEATFKIVAVGGQVLSSSPYYENYSRYVLERRFLLNRIKRKRIKGVFFLSGDRHFTELTKKCRIGKYPLHDLTVSPLTSVPHSNGYDFNRRRVKGSYVAERNFATLHFTGNGDSRRMMIKVLNADGEEMWREEIGKKEFGYK